MRRGLAVVMVLAGCAGHADELDVEPPREPDVDAIAYAIPDEAAPSDAFGPTAVAEPDPRPDAPEPRVLEYEDLHPIPGNEPSRSEPTSWELADACARGRADARADDETGMMRLDTWGYPATCAFDYWARLERRYDVHVVHHGCVVEVEPPLVLHHRRCYAGEVQAIVQRRHGRNAYERLWKEVERECNRRQRRADRKQRDP